MVTANANSEMQRQGKRYGNLPNRDSAENNEGYLSAGCARKPPIAGPMISPIPQDVQIADIPKDRYLS
nr:hypothetical protein Iba_chr10eCG9100 [Ipomoea batatas]GME03013.1 hypothetical protein Iba_scaffold301CG0010 [Ipomoea batatas]